jgi:tRNA(Ile)-lysidine synthase TilS/MesJ
MPTLDLTDMELATAAMGVRGVKRQALADAERQENPGIKAQFERSAKAAEELVEKFERARRSGQ